jgi:hypothetical protein
MEIPAWRDDEDKFTPSVPEAKQRRQLRRFEHVRMIIPP